MQTAHGGLAEPVVVQLQHWVHLSLNATERSGREHRETRQGQHEQPDRRHTEREMNMAYATDIRTGSQGILRDRVNAIVESFRKAREQRRVYSQTMSELRALNARELADLGIGACEIPFIAREAANMVK